MAAQIPTGPRVDAISACRPELQRQAFLDGEGKINLSSLGIFACYDLEIQVLLEPPQAVGEAEITFTNPLGVGLDEIVFRLYPEADVIYGGSVALRRVAVDGAPADYERFLRDGTGLRILLEEPILPGETRRIEIDYTMEIPVDFVAADTIYGIFNYDRREQTIMLASAYPLLAPLTVDSGWQATEVIPEGDAVTSESALYLVRLELPEGFEVATTGNALADPEEPGAEVIVTGPARDFMIALFAEHDSLQEEVDGIMVNGYFAADEPGLGQTAVSLSADALGYFNETFGEYPFRELDVVQAPLHYARGVEFPGVILVAGSEDRMGNQKEAIVFRVATVHEVAHQWWYSLVGNDVLQEPWLDESLTSWSSLAYFQSRDPEIGDLLLESWMGEVERANQEGQEGLIRQPLAEFSGSAGSYGFLVYVKGAVFFHALREEIGDEAFFAGLQSYFQGNRFGFAHPEELLAAFEEKAGRDLQPFFAGWGINLDS